MRLNRAKSAFFVLLVALRWFFFIRQARKARAKPGIPLVVSLTSYPKRYPTLHLTLKTILMQSMQPESVVLWIARDDRNTLPLRVTALAAHGLDIRYCEDLKSYKKIIPALLSFPGTHIVTADDDLYFPSTWLQELVEEYDPSEREVVCHRVHRICVGQDGKPLPYLSWKHEISCSKPDPLNFPTSGAGVLFPPGVLHPDVTRSDIFLSLCPSADDVWLYWMLGLAGTKVRKIGRRRKLIAWLHSQDDALWNTNSTQNDTQVRNLIARYGFPAASVAQTSLPI